MANTHLLNLEDLKGTEYLAGGYNVLSDVDFLLENSITWPSLWKYNQNEFASDFGYNLCTLYGFFRRLSTLIGRELTPDERYAMCQERVTIRFDRSVGGYYVDWADVVRHWHNNLFPNDPIFSVVIDNSDPIREKFFQKGITITSCFRANAKYNADIKDWVLNNLDYGTPTYGHCVGYHRLLKEDNYLNDYSFRSIDDYYKLLAKSLEGRTSIGLFKVSNLTETGKLLLKAMQSGLTNGERLNDLCTRFEASRFAMKMRPWIPEAKIWSKKSPNLPVSFYELSIMVRWSDHAYLGTDRSKTLTRRDAILYIMKETV